MGHSHFSDLSMALIHRAEDECAVRDPGMLRSAAMVLVGDVYALLVCQADSSMPPAAAADERDDGLSPFIR